MAFLVLPMFGFANAGVALAGLARGALLAPLLLGIAAGLFVGKRLDVFLAAWAAVRLSWADISKDATLPQVHGVSLLCGIDFTMSLFIGLRAFPASPELQDGVKLGVLAGSVLRAGTGVLVVAFARSERPGPMVAP